MVVGVSPQLLSLLVLLWSELGAGLRSGQHLKSVNEHVSFEHVSFDATRTYELTEGDSAFYADMLPSLPTVNGAVMNIDEADTEVFLPISYHGGEAPLPAVGKCKKFYAERQEAGWHSHYFTWLSKSLAQPILSGYKSSGRMFEWKNKTWQKHTGKRPCGSCFADCPFTGMTNSNYDGQKAACCDGMSTCTAWLDKKGVVAPPQNPRDHVQALYDKGHQVPDSAMAKQWGADLQTYSMCNIGPQSSVLNELKWMWHEKMLNCVGQQKKLTILTGPLPPFRADPMQCLKGGGVATTSTACKSKDSMVPWPTDRDFVPAGWWKLIRDVDRQITFVYLFHNDWQEDTCAYQHAGEEGMQVIESSTGFHFPAEWKTAYGKTDDEFLEGSTGCKIRNDMSGEFDCKGSAPSIIGHVLD